MKDMSMAVFRRIRRSDPFLVEQIPWEDLFDLPPYYLERLVWTKPAVEIALEFRVSDSYVSKRCRQLGVRKPGRGFWAKVDAGKIPYPNGRPPEA